MNHSLLDPFQIQGLPEYIEEYLEYGQAKCVAFNRPGTLLAAGTAEGQVVIWDFEVRGVARAWPGHSKGVVKLAWSRNGRFLASAGMDFHIILWDVLTGSQIVHIPLRSTPLSLFLHPSEPNIWLVSTALESPILVDCRTGSGHQLHPLTLSPVTPTRPPEEINLHAQAAGTVDAQGGTASEAPSRSQDEVVVSHYNNSSLAIFSKCGQYVFQSHPKGIITVLNVNQLHVVDLVQLGSGDIRCGQMVLNRKGTLLLMSHSDRVIRLVSVRPPPHGGVPLDHIAEALNTRKPWPERGSLLHPEESAMLFPTLEFSYSMDYRSLWRSVCFTHDDEYVAAASSSKKTHNVFFWKRHDGKGQGVLEGPKDTIVDMAWHPSRPVMVTVSQTGSILVWAKAYQESWSAFAPDFVEIDENVLYKEKEDEMDQNTEAPDVTTKREVDEQDEDGDIDIRTVIPQHLCSSDDEHAADQLHYLPVIVEPEAEVPADPIQEQQELERELMVGQERLGAEEMSTPGEYGQDMLDNDEEFTRPLSGRRSRSGGLDDGEMTSPSMSLDQSEGGQMQRAKRTRRAPQIPDYIMG